MAFKTKSGAGGNETRISLKEAGESVTGYYLGNETFEHNGEERRKELVRMKTGAKASFFVSGYLHSDLDEVTPGTLIRVTFNGKKKTKKGRLANSYTLEIDEDDTIDLNAPVPSVADIAAQMKSGGATLKVS